MNFGKSFYTKGWFDNYELEIKDLNDLIELISSLAIEHFSIDL
jgi:hypothetical protein